MYKMHLTAALMGGLHLYLYFITFCFLLQINNLHLYWIEHKNNSLTAKHYTGSHLSTPTLTNHLHLYLQTVSMCLQNQCCRKNNRLCQHKSVEWSSQNGDFFQVRDYLYIFRCFPLLSCQAASHMTHNVFWQARSAPVDSWRQSLVHVPSTSMPLNYILLWGRIEPSQ